MPQSSHVHRYARIKGVPERSVAAAAEAKLRELDLVKYADRLAGGFSGGNKRKLSVAVALLGGAQIIVLDEPSTGEWSAQQATHPPCVYFMARVFGSGGIMSAHTYCRRQSAVSLRTADIVCTEFKLRSVRHEGTH
jgi:ABC-type uncharacterized transport system ATPase subunit